MHGLLAGAALFGRVRMGCERAWILQLQCMETASGMGMGECCICCMLLLVGLKVYSICRAVVGSRGCGRPPLMGAGAHANKELNKLWQHLSHVKLCRVHLGTAFGEGAGLADNVGTICETLVPPCPSPHLKAIAIALHAIHASADHAMTSYSE